VPQARTAPTPTISHRPFHGEGRNKTARGGRPYHREGQGEKRLAAIRNSKYLPKKPEKRKTERFSGQFFTLFWYISLHNFLKTAQQVL
jgi:hypothetical protein